MCTLVDGPCAGEYVLPEMYRPKFDAGRLNQRTLTLRADDPTNYTRVCLYDSLGTDWRFRYRETQTKPEYA